VIAPGVHPDDISESHLLALITEGVAERRTVEYKSELPGSNDDARKEFLADVSSFANASGGDLIYGIKAEDGVPVEITPLTINPDQDRLTWEQVIRTGAQPRILGIVVRDIPVKGGHALLFRIPRSFVGPHAVTYKGSHSLRFYSRTSAGKYPLDVAELRSAFLNTSGLSETIRNFQTDRLGQALSGGHAVRFADGAAKIVVHLIPLTAFTNEASIDLLQALDQPWLYPLGTPRAPSTRPRRRRRESPSSAARDPRRQAAHRRHRRNAHRLGCPHRRPHTRPSGASLPVRRAG
jgi:hypothetical protein